MNLTCSPEPYSAVRNANVDLVNYKRGKLFKYWKEKGEKKQRRVSLFPCWCFLCDEICQRAVQPLDFSAFKSIHAAL